MEFGFVKKPVGPLPLWGWMGIALAGLLGIASWKNRNAAKSEATDDSTSARGLQADDYGTAYDPYVTFVDADVTNVTYGQAPPGGGREPTPSPAPATTTTPVPTPSPGPIVTPRPTPTPSPAPKPTPRPTPPAPAGQYMTLNAKYRKGRQKGTLDTVWGIAERAYGNGALWKQIWNAPQNAAIRAKRKTPDMVQIGDRFWVPKK